MSTFDTIMSGQAVSRIRRNHGLEHATLHVLAEKYPHRNVDLTLPMARSNFGIGKV